jgi:perosamine synthetase
LKNKLCTPDKSLHFLLEVLNVQPSGFAFIVDDNDKLLGLVTDGDIRRFLLTGGNLEQKVLDLKVTQCTYAKVDDKQSEILKKLNSKIRILPLVDDNLIPVDYVQYDERKHIPVAMPNLEGNELKYVTDAVMSTWISSSGKYITDFEREFPSYIGAEFGVSTSNGTVALSLALLALGVGDGDEVIVPDLTFAATINAVLHVNATPVIVDVEKDSWCIDPGEIKKAITDKTKAIIPVHLYGQSCDMSAIMAIAERHNLFVIEDCAEAHGAEFEGAKVGCFGDISCFSFFGNKIITTGEGGMCLTNSQSLDKKMRQLRDHGMSVDKRYWHDVVGYNYRMTNLQAAIGCAQLERIETILAEREKIEKEYQNILKNIQGINLQHSFPNRKKVTWLVSALIDESLLEKFVSTFKEKNIDVRPFFYPLSQMPIYKKYAFSGENAAEISKKGISFPTHKNIDFEYIRDVLSKYLTQITH